MTRLRYGVEKLASGAIRVDLSWIRIEFAFLTGALIMAYNLWMTVRRAPLAEATPAAAPAE